MNNHDKKKGFKLPVPRLRGNGFLKQLSFAAALAFGTIAVTPAHATRPNTATNFSMITPTNSNALIGDSIQQHFVSSYGATIYQVKITAVPSHGMLMAGSYIVMLNGTVPAEDLSSLVYIPNTGYTGADAFSWKVDDGDFLTNAATASFTVQTSNNLPTVTSSSVALDNNSYVSVGQEMQSQYSDADADAISSITITRAPLHGTLQYDGYVYGVGSVIQSYDMDYIFYIPNGAPIQDDFEWTASDGHGNAISSATLTLTVAGQGGNHAPSITAASPVFDPIMEDSPNASGTPVSSFVSASDADGPVSGIAVTGMSGAGQWQRSTDGGATWWGVDYGSPALAPLSENNAVLLNGSALIRFAPNANWNGVAELTFRAWDETSGANIEFVNVSSNGGSTAFSSNKATATLEVVAENDAPVVLTPGAISVLNFGGGGDYADAGTSVQLSGATTVEGWIYMDNVYKNWERVIDFANGSGQDNVIFGFNSTTGHMFIETFDDEGSSNGHITTPNIFPTGKWVHVAAVWDGQNTSSIYWDGVLQVSAYDNNIPAVTRNNNYLGRSNWADEFFAGKMSEMKIWNKARSAQEIAADMHDTLTGNEAGLAAYYKCNDGTGNVLHNYKAGGQGADLYGASWMKVSGPAAGITGPEHTKIPVIGLSFTDIDAASGSTVTVRLGAQNGLIAVSTSVQGGISSSDISMNNSGAVEINSTIDKINATFADSAGLSYTGVVGFSGDDEIKIVMDDQGNTGGGGPMQDSKSIAVTITPNPNTPPVVSGFAVTVNENDSVRVSQFANASMFTDIDGDQPAEATITTLPSNGTLSTAGNNIQAGDIISIADFASMVYTPNLGFYGADSFTFNGSDGTAYADTAATVSIEVKNQAPILTNQNYNASENTDMILVASLSASQDFYLDPENDLLTKIMIITLPSNGTLLLDGQPVVAMQEVLRNDIVGLVYRPNFMFVGNDQFTVNAFDGLQYASSAANISIDVAHVNFAPTDLTLSSNTIDENQPSGTVIGTIHAEVLDTNTTLSYTLISGAGDDDNGAFAILSGDQLIATQAFDYETKSELSIRLKVEDANGTSLEKVFTINVHDIAEGPSDIAITNVYFPENAPTSTLVGSLATISDEAGTYSYGFASGAGDEDNAFFTIDGNQLLTNVSADFEVKSQYTVRVKSKNDISGLATEKQLTINVTDANDAPTSIALTNTSILDNQPVGSVVGDFTTTDQDVNDTFTYALVSGAGSQDNGFFAISGGQLITGSVLNANSQSSYAVRVMSTDAKGLSTEKEFQITATHTTQGITGITISNAAIDENQLPGAIVGTLASQSQDPNETYTYSFVQGAGSQGNSYFTINGDQLVSNVSFDYEAQNLYNIRVRSTNSQGQHFDKLMYVIIRDINDAPTDVNVTITNAAENLPAGTAVGFFNTDDQDLGDAHTYTLVGGAGDADNAHFSVNLNKLVATGSFDFETQSEYSVRVRSTDAHGASTERSMTINVVDVNEAPTLLSNATDVIAENLPVGTVITTLATTDEDRGDTHTYSMAAGNGDEDNASFSILNNQLVSNQIFNYETKKDYAIRIKTTDAGGLSLEKQLTIHIADVNDAPVASAMNFAINMNSDLTLFARNFTQSYADDEQTPLASIRITSLPQQGILTLQGVAVGINSMIPTSRLNNLVYTPDRNFVGVDNFEWSAFDGSDFAANPAMVSIDVQLGSNTYGSHLGAIVSHNAYSVQPGLIAPSTQNKEAGTTGIDQAQQVDAMNVTNYPNPFANTTSIRYELPADMHVSVKVYDMTGKEVSTLVNSQQSAGTYTSDWNGKGASMDAVSEGQYLYVLTATDADGKVTVKTGKMVKVK